VHLELSPTSLLVQALNGLSFGTVLFLIALGLTLIFGVLGVLNFAHGALYMVGAYLAFQVTYAWIPNFWVALLVVPLMVAAFGGALEVIFLRRLYGRDVVYQLLLTVAFVLILNDGVRMLWGSGPHAVAPPDPFGDPVKLLGRYYPSYRLFLIALAPLFGLAVWLALERTRAGKIIRAAAMDREMAGALGVNVPLVFTGVFCLGAGLAGVAGVLAAPLFTIAPAMGDEVIIDSFIVAVIGGLGSFPGAFAGALLLGVFHTLGSVLVPGLQLAFASILMAVVLLVRPRGLFGVSA
jgi:branched-chain amino acid transport system permease protein